MKAIKYIFSALVGMVALASCDSNITDFEYQGYTGAPKTIDASAVTSEALPGAIRLNWTASCRFHFLIYEDFVCKSS